MRQLQQIQKKWLSRICKMKMLTDYRASASAGARNSKPRLLHNEDSIARYWNSANLAARLYALLMILIVSLILL